VLEERQLAQTTQGGEGAIQGGALVFAGSRSDNERNTRGDVSCAGG